MYLNHLKSYSSCDNIIKKLKYQRSNMQQLMIYLAHDKAKAFLCYIKLTDKLLQNNYAKKWTNITGASDKKHHKGS